MITVKLKLSTGKVLELTWEEFAELRAELGASSPPPLPHPWQTPPWPEPPFEPSCLKPGLVVDIP